MSAKTPNEPYSAQLPLALLNALDTNHRISLYLIENVPAETWKARLPDGKGRTIAAIVSNMHNVRVMWLKAAKADDIPGQLDRATITPQQASRALESSRTALHKLSRRALETDGRIKGFRPDVAGFVGYFIAHDAHHRGQIAMLARQLGHPPAAEGCVWHVGVGLALSSSSDLSPVPLGKVKDPSLSPQKARRHGWRALEIFVSGTITLSPGYAKGGVALQSGLGRQQATPKGAAVRA